MARLCIIKNIDSAHGKNIHGYTFKIEINFVDKLINNMVGNLDFHDINPKIDYVINKLDKTYIDDVIQEKYKQVIYIILKMHFLNLLMMKI